MKCYKNLREVKSLGMLSILLFWFSILSKKEIRNLKSYGGVYSVQEFIHPGLCFLFM